MKTRNVYGCIIIFACNYLVTSQLINYKTLYAKKKLKHPKPVDMLFPDGKPNSSKTENVLKATSSHIKEKTGQAPKVGGKESSTSKKVQKNKKNAHKENAKDTHCPRCPYKNGKKSPVCEASIDIGFVVESSTSLGRVGPGNQHRLIHFVGLIARKFKISNDRARVGLVTYASKPLLLFGMTENVGKIIDGLQKGIKMKFKDQRAKTGKALKFAHKAFFNGSGRFNKVLVVITDGRSNDKLKQAVKSIKQDGIKILGVGVGRYFDIKELNQMASRPVLNHVFTSDFKKLIFIRDEIVKTVCHGVGGNLVTPGKRPCACKHG